MYFVRQFEASGADYFCADLKLDKDDKLLVGGYWFCGSAVVIKFFRNVVIC